MESPCDKISFSTLKEANSVIKVIKKGRVNKRTKPRRAYKCEFCGLFHLTSKFTYTEEKQKKARKKLHNDQEEWNRQKMKQVKREFGSIVK